MGTSTLLKFFAPRPPSRPEQPRIFLFDFDGVVADSFDIFKGEFLSVCTDMGFDKLNSTEAFLRLFEGNLLRQLVRSGFPVWRLKQFAEMFSPRIAEANRHVSPFAGMPELLTELAAAWPLYVITSNMTSAIEEFISRHQVQGVRGILGADVEPSKVKKIRRVRALHPGHAAFYIGDTKGDMVEGRQAGAITVAAGWGWHSEALLRAGKPAFFVPAPEKLRAVLMSDAQCQ